MHFRNYLYILAALCLLGLSGCYKDKGNYDYTEPNKVTINGIKPSYSIMQGDYLEIIPELVSSYPDAGDSARYTYEWTGLKAGALIGDKVKALGKNKSLRMVTSLPAGSYEVYYRVTDTLTGIMFQKTFNMTVATAIYEGWMLMTDVNGAPRLDMLSKINGQFNVIQDVLSFVGSTLKLEGKPVAVSCFKQNALSTGYSIYLSTTKTTDRIDAETFQYTSTLNIGYDVLSNVPSTFAPYKIANAGSYRAFLLEGTDAYYYNYVMNIYFGLPINVMKGEATPFRIAPFYAANTSGTTPVTAFYDIDKKRFVRHVSDDATCSTMPDGTIFDFNTGMDLVYMTYTSFNNGNAYAILHNDTTNKYFLARFAVGSTISQVDLEEMPATDLDQASYFGVSPDLGYIFYTVGSKLYSYDRSAKTSKLMMDKGTGANFTQLQFSGSVLWLASIDPSQPEGSNGVLESYTIPPIQANLVQTNRFTGVGKIVSFSYRTR